MIDRSTAIKALILAWPIALQHALTNVLSMIDVVMVSHLGDAAVAAVGFGNRFIFVLTCIILGVAWTVGILVAQYFGARQLDRLRSTVLLGCFLSTAVLLPICIANIFLADNIISLGTSNPEVIELGQRYLWFTVPSVIAVGIVFSFDSALRSLNQARLPMVLSAIAIFINILLNIWLIHGGFGVPALGVVGAALATLIARTLHVFLLLGVLYFQKNPLSIRFVDLLNLNKLHEVKKFLKLSMPMLISFGVWSAGTFGYQLIYGRMGTAELAVTSMMIPIESIFLSLFMGLASACAILTGQALGADKFDTAWRNAKAFTILNPALGIACGLFVLLFRDLILMPFSGIAASTLELANSTFVAVVMCSWMKVANMTFAMGVLRAGGDTKVCMYIDATGLWLVSIPLTATAAFVWHWPLPAVVLISYSEEICKASLFVLRMRKRIWLRNLTNN